MIHCFRKIVCLSLLSGTFILFSCGHPKEKSPTDIVNIPATSADGLNKDDLPVIKFDEELFDFGTIRQGEKMSHVFKFTNTGANELIISNAYAECGCTVAEFPKEPILSGKDSVIRVTFDSSHKTGIVNKTITLVTNCIPNKHVISIKANIVLP